MEGHEVDSAGAPRIERVAGKLAQLERMADYREARLSAGEVRGGGEHFARAEASALRAGIAALRYHRAQVEGLDDPVLALQALVDALGGADEEADSAELQEALRRAEAVLREWEAQR